jgi:HSP20 family protein
MHREQPHPAAARPGGRYGRDRPTARLAAPAPRNIVSPLKGLDRIAAGCGPPCLENPVARPISSPCPPWIRSTAMNITRFEPWYLMNRLHRDLDRLMTPGEEPQTAVVDWVPAVDVREEDAQFVIHADLPGVDPKNIEITLEKGELTIRGRRELEKREEKAGFRRVERVSGEFYRRFTLPDTADSHAVKARHTNGVLEVTIPKQAQVLPRKVSVEAA